jgi:hypothetical protein
MKTICEMLLSESWTRAWVRTCIHNIKHCCIPSYLYCPPQPHPSPSHCWDGTPLFPNLMMIDTNRSFQLLLWSCQGVFCWAYGKNKQTHAQPFIHSHIGSLWTWWGSIITSSSHLTSDECVSPQEERGESITRISFHAQGTMKSTEKLPAIHFDAGTLGNQRRRS